MGSRLGPGRNPGAYFDRGDLETETRTKGPGGGYTSSWAPASAAHADVPISIEALDGTERLRAMQAAANVTHHVETSVYVEGASAAMRWKITSDGDRILDIVSAPITIGRKRRLLFMCEEATS